MRRRQRLSLRGRLEAFANPAGCEARQVVQIQRRPLRSVTFRTFATRRTSRTGTFSLATRPTASYVYRARVAQSDDCHGAVSNRERVRVRR